MNDAIKSAELKEKLKKISAEEQTNKIATDISNSIVAFMGGAVRVLTLGSVVFLALQAVLTRTSVSPLNWVEAVSIYGTYEILINTIKRLRAE